MGSKAHPLSTHNSALLPPQARERRGPGWGTTARGVTLWPLAGKRLETFAGGAVAGFLTLCSPPWSTKTTSQELLAQRLCR